MGAILIALAAGALLLDRPPVYPCLLTLVVLLGLIAGYEMVQLLRPTSRLNLWVTLAAIEVVVLANWAAPALRAALPGEGGDSWYWISGAFAGVVLAAFLGEILTFREAGGAVVRLALLTWAVAYLALLPSFLIQLRWLQGEKTGTGTTAVALAIFVPKCCDIGAFFTGKLLGRHRMAPRLSPKKTWEGLVGGLAVAALTSVGINSWHRAAYSGDEVVYGGVFAWAVFGVVVGLAGVLGDLAESVIKRDCHAKDASQVVPGFGGVLDVIDAVLFGAPVAYLWLHWQVR
jgi:phosphatidate cytidylyltransferase